MRTFLIAASLFLAASSASAQPAPVKAKSGHALGLCPNPAGLVAFDAAATRAARASALAYGRKSRAADLARSDRAWWPEVEDLWRRGQKPLAGERVVAGSQPAAANGYKVFLRPACGQAAVEKTLIVTVAPATNGKEEKCNACRSSFFFVDRRGHALLYFIY